MDKPKIVCIWEPHATASTTSEFHILDTTHAFLHICFQTSPYSPSGDNGSSKHIVARTPEGQQKEIWAKSEPHPQGITIVTVKIADLIKEGYDRIAFHVSSVSYGFACVWGIYSNGRYSEEG